MQLEEKIMIIHTTPNKELVRKCPPVVKRAITVIIPKKLFKRDKYTSNGRLSMIKPIPWVSYISGHIFTPDRI